MGSDLKWHGYTPKLKVRINIEFFLGAFTKQNALFVKVKQCNIVL